MKQEDIDKLKTTWEAIKVEERHHTDVMVPLCNELHRLRCNCDHKYSDGTEAKKESFSLAPPFDDNVTCAICGIDWEAASWIRKKRELLLNEIFKYHELEIDFIAHIYPIEIKEDCIRIIGRNCDKDLRLGDKLNGMEILKIEAYDKSLDICGRGMTCSLTLKRNKGNYGDLGHYYLGRDDPCSMTS